MSIFGWSYPAGAAGDPFAPYNMQAQPYTLEVNREGFAAYWGEDGEIYAGLDCAEPPQVDVYHPDDRLTDAENLALAVSRAQDAIDRPRAALGEIMCRHCADSIGRLGRNMYKYTDCGAALAARTRYLRPDNGADPGPGYEGECVIDQWHYGDDLYQLPASAYIVALSLSSIVEGVEQCTETHDIDLTRNALPTAIADEFDQAVAAVEREAREIWNETHGCETCAKLQGRDFDDEAGDIPVWPECPDCKGSGVAI